MRPRARRVLLFVAMVGTGLAAAYLLSDPFAGRQRAAVGELQDDGRDGRIRVADREGESATTVLLGRVEFELTEMVSLGPGRTEERVVYRVRIASGRPDAKGDILAEQPLITVLDRRTGRENGTLRADEARFQTDGAVGGQVTVDFGRMRAQDFSLAGGVRGDFTMSDGGLASFEAESMLVRDGIVTAPGRVRWTRDDMSLDGVDMTWDEASGALDLRTDAHLELAPAGDRPGYAFAAPAGLSAVLPPAGTPDGERTRAELRGPVTGTSTDGGRLAADSLHVDAGPGSQEGGSPIQRERARLRSDSRVTWTRGGLTVAGTGMTVDEADGRLELLRDAQLSMHDEAGATTMEVLAEGGLVWQTPPDATDPRADGLGTLRGPVSGRTSEGLLLAAGLATIDAAQGRLELSGDATISSDDGLVLASDRIALVSREDARRVEIPGPARWTLPDARGEGTGLTWDDAQGKLSVERDVFLLLAASPGAEPWELSADGRLEWTRHADAPEGAPLRGVGEVRGHVRGSHPTDGSFLTEHLLLDGLGQHISLRGPSSWSAGEADAGGAGVRGMALQAQTRIDLRSGADGAARSVLAEGRAVARLAPRDGSAPALSAERITLDEGSRTLELEGDVLAEGLDADGGSRVTAGERLVARFDAQDELLSVQAAGRVSFERGFLVVSDELAWDVPGDEAVLRGDCLLRQGGVAMRCVQIEVRPRERAFRILRSSVQLDG